MTEDKKVPTEETPPRSAEPSNLFTGCCLVLFVLCGVVVGAVVGPMVAFQRGAGDFDFVGIAPGIVVGGVVGFLAGYLFLASHSQDH